MKTRRSNINQHIGIKAPMIRKPSQIDLCLFSITKSMTCWTKFWQVRFSWFVRSRRTPENKRELLPASHKAVDPQDHPTQNRIDPEIVDSPMGTVQEYVPVFKTNQPGLAPGFCDVENQPGLSPRPAR